MLLVRRKSNNEQGSVLFKQIFKQPLFWNTNENLAIKI